MDWKDVLLLCGPGLVWIGLWTQFATIRFYDKSENIYKDLVSSGERDMALTNIETRKVIPALARLCDAVTAARAGKRPTDDPIPTEELLAECDFLEYLSEAEAALREKRNIEDAISQLRSLAAWLWKVSLLHSLVIVAGLGLLLLPATMARFFGVSIAILCAAVSFVFLIVGSVRFQARRDALHTLLSANRVAR
jgi:hypothetical protein